MDELRADQGIYSLRLGTSLLRTGHTGMLVVIVLGLPLFVLACLQWLLQGDAGPSGFWSGFREELTSDPGDRLMVLTVAVLASLGGVFLALQTRARLLVTSAGLEADIPRLLAPGLPAQTVGQWSLRWEDVQNIRLVLPPESVDRVRRLRAARLLVETPRRSVWLAPFAWFEAGGADHRLGLREIIGVRRLDVDACLRRAPLMRAVAARSVELRRGAGEDNGTSQAFDLADHKGLAMQIALFFAAGLYALADTFFIASWKPLGPLPALPFAAVGAVAAGAAWKLGKGAPLVERAAIGALTVAACLAAVHPAVLRVNAYTAEAEAVPYVSLGAGRFEPADRGLPPIDFAAEEVPEYWAQYPPGAEHRFTLLKGRAGFYQVAMEPFYERTRAFYRSRD